MAGAGKDRLEDWIETDETRDEEKVSDAYSRIEIGEFSLEDIINEVHRAAALEKGKEEKTEEILLPPLPEKPKVEIKQAEIKQIDDENLTKIQESGANIPPIPNQTQEEQKIAQKLEDIFGGAEGGTGVTPPEPEEYEEERRPGLFATLKKWLGIDQEEEESDPLEDEEDEPDEESDLNGEDEEPQEDQLDILAEELTGQKKKVHLRFTAALIVTGLLLILVAMQVLQWPQNNPIGFDTAPVANMAVQLTLCALVMGLLYKEVGEGLKKLLSLAPNQMSISTLGLLSSLLHGLLQISAVRGGESFLFFGPAAALCMTAAVWAKDVRLGLSLNHVNLLWSCPVKQQLEIVKDPQMKQAILEELGDGADPSGDLVLIKREKIRQTYDTKKILGKTDDSAKWDEKISPIMIVVMILATAAVLLLTRQGGKLLTVFTVFSITVVPITGHFSSLLPMKWANRRAPKSVILNNTEIEEFLHCDGLILNDSDLFDPGTVILKGMRVCGEDNRIDELIVSVASVFNSLDLALGGVFLEILKGDTGGLKEVSKVGCYRGEGIRAIVAGEEIVIGTREFMQKCGIISPYEPIKPEPENQKIKSIYVAKGDRLACVFSVGYVVRGTTKLELASLYKNNINIFLDTGDMNLTKKNLINLFGMEEDGVFTVHTRKQEAKGERRQSKGVYTLEDNLFSFSDTIWACRHMKGMQWRNIMINIVLSAISFILFFILMALGGFDQVTVANILLYLGICAIPSALNSLI